MAHFYGNMAGARTKTVTKTGTKKSGMSAHVRGWYFGVKVNIFFDEKTGKNKAVIYQTAGSNGKTEDVLIANITEK